MCHPTNHHDCSAIWGIATQEQVKLVAQESKQQGLQIQNAFCSFPIVNCQSVRCVRSPNWTMVCHLTAKTHQTTTLARQAWTHWQPMHTASKEKASPSEIDWDGGLSRGKAPGHKLLVRLRSRFWEDIKGFRRGYQKVLAIGYRSPWAFWDMIAYKELRPNEVCFQTPNSLLSMSRSCPCHKSRSLNQLSSCCHRDRPWCSYKVVAPMPTTEGSSEECTANSWNLELPMWGAKVILCWANSLLQPFWIGSHLHEAGSNLGQQGPAKTCENHRISGHGNCPEIVTLMRIESPDSCKPPGLGMLWWNLYWQNVTKIWKSPGSIYASICIVCHWHALLFRCGAFWYAEWTGPSNRARSLYLVSSILGETCWQAPGHVFSGPDNSRISIAA